MKRIKQFSASLILLAVYIISVGYLAMVVPADASIPIHWNARGEIDAYTSKGGAVLFALGLNIALFLLMFLLPLYSPRYKQQAPRFEKVLPKMTFMLLVFFSLLNLYMLAHPLIRVELPVNPVLIIIGLMLAVLGNILPKVPRNFFVGIRTPWTISNSVVWEKTHRLGGLLFKISGVLALLGIFFPPLAIWFVLVPVLIAAFVTVLYSYLVFRQIEQKS